METPAISVPHGTPLPIARESADNAASAGRWDARAFLDRKYAIAASAGLFLTVIITISRLGRKESAIEDRIRND
jgi:hypothetical protein